MVRIWAKIIKKGKIIKQWVLEKSESMDYSLFFDYLTEICSALDIPTPVLIKQHLFNYAKYNAVKFIADDFLETIEFDRLVLENLSI